MPFTRPCLKRHLTVWRATTELETPAREGSSIVLHYGRERGMVLEELDEAQLLLLSLLNGEHTVEELVARLQAFNPQITAGDVDDFLTVLTESSLLEDAAVTPPPELTPTDLTRYSGQILVFSALDASGVQKYEMQKRLKQARVSVLGLGGLGCNVVLGLAAAGIGFIRGVDCDQVELSNLNRQILYQVADIGRPKAEAAATHVRAFNPEITFEPVQARIESAEQIVQLIQGTDVVVLSADHPASIAVWMNAAALHTHIPFIGGSYNGAVVDIGPFVVPYLTSCLGCHVVVQHELPDVLAWTRAPGWQLHPNVHFVTATAANLIVSEIIKFLTGFARPTTYNNHYLLSFEAFTLSPVPLPRDEGCPACGTGARLNRSGREGCVSCDEELMRSLIPASADGSRE